MKKSLFLIVILGAVVTSCKTVSKSASQGTVPTTMASAVVGDLDVSDTKITYTYKPSLRVIRGGYRNCLNAAITEALAQNGGGDVLVETQEAIVQKRGLVWKKISSITVSGYPARYKNFRPAKEEIVNQIILDDNLIKKNTVSRHRAK